MKNKSVYRLLIAFMCVSQQAERIISLVLYTFHIKFLTAFHSFGFFFSVYRASQLNYLQFIEFVVCFFILLRCTVEAT